MDVGLQSMASRKLRWEPALPSAVSGVLIYVGVMTLGLLMVQPWLWHAQEPPFLVAMWLTYGGAAQVRRVFGLVGILLVLYLWVRWRSVERGAGWSTLVAYVGAGALVLLLHWGLAQALEAVPRYELVPLYP